MNLKNISIVSVASIFIAITAIWNFKDSFVSAAEFDKMQQQVKQATIQQTAIIIKIDKHLEWEKQQTIYEYEDRLEKLYKIENPNADERADIKKYEARLKPLLESN